MGAGAGTATNNEWFREVFGFPESQGKFEYDSGTGVLKTKPSKTGQDRTNRTFCAGKFETPSLEELQKRVDLEKASKAFGGRRLTIREIVGDVAELHTKAENRHATFQAASQFNTLEHTSQHGKPEDGITCYARDRTQGPACATACAAGTIIRNYFAFGPSEGQTAYRQVKNLEEIELLLDNESNDYFEVMNGYTLSTNKSLAGLAEALREDDELCAKIRRKLRIGVQADTEVVCSGFGAKMYDGRRREQLVTQAYCSAVSVSYSRCRTDSWEPFARLILEALFEATLYVAAENALRHPKAAGSRKVFLTAVGGGVFGNEMVWIYDAIHKAALRFEQVGLEIFLVSYRDSTPEFEQLEASWGFAAS